MKWTKKKPQDEGWYWCKYKPDDWRDGWLVIVEALENNNTKEIDTIVCDGKYYTTNDPSFLEFAGPLPEPQE